ncbi:MAG: ribbon-helix-helix domain-containing protein [Alphaproteobacteria bacterium]|nr:ribbon-helix-helix domain-containing protein [Alphaproteobacteria bacterium]
MLQSRTVFINGRKVNVHLRQETWDAVAFICKSENIPFHKLSSIIDKVKGISDISCAIEIFANQYFKERSRNNPEPIIIDTVPVFVTEKSCQ